MQITPREYAGRAVTIFEDAFRACLVEAGTVTPKDRVRDAQAILGYMLEMSRRLLKFSGGSVDDYATFSTSLTSPSC